MPVTYYSSTGALSFAPVAPRDQAVAPIEVAVRHSPPDEIIEARGDSPAQMSRRCQTLYAIAMLTTLAFLIFAGSIS